MTTFCPPLHALCAQCHKFVGRREQTFAPKGLFENVYSSDGKTKDDDKKLIRWSYNEEIQNVYVAHQRCLACVLCERSMHDAPYGMTFGKQDKTRTSSSGGRSSNMSTTTTMLPIYNEILCKGPPGSNGWCSDDFEEYKQASKRLNDLSQMTVQDLQKILTDRRVLLLKDNYNDNDNDDDDDDDDDDKDDKDSLICKVIVTDKRKGRMKSHAVGTSSCSCCTGGESSSSSSSNYNCSDKSRHHLVSQRESPGAILRDRKCLHGDQQSVVGTTDRRDENKTTVISDLITNAHTPNFSPHSFWNYWKDKQDMLRNEIKERVIPNALWSAAVSSVITEEGGFEYALNAVLLSLMVDILIAKVASILPSSRSITTKEALHELFDPNHCSIVKSITKNESNLFSFMHHNTEKRKCDCMKYVVAAAEIGTLRTNKPSKIERNIEYCALALCHQPLARPLVCSRCNTVAYCSKQHQTTDWASHKKNCKRSNSKK